MHLRSEILKYALLSLLIFMCDKGHAMQPTQQAIKSTLKRSTGGGERRSMQSKTRVRQDWGLMSSASPQKKMKTEIEMLLELRERNALIKQKYGWITPQDSEHSVHYQRLTGREEIGR